MEEDCSGVVDAIRGVGAGVKVDVWIFCGDDRLSKSTLLEQDKVNRSRQAKGKEILELSCMPCL